jgi:hypothetical protein
MSEQIQKKEDFINEFMQEEDLQGKPIMDIITKITDKIGFDKEKVRQAYHLYKQNEDFANEVMSELGIKGRANKIKIMRIIDIVGKNKQKVKVGFLRSTISSRIHHE